MEILVLQGLPASGKSTFAKTLTQTNKNWIRVNRDDIRTMFNFEWNNYYEELVRQIELDMVKTIIGRGFSVVIDDTNLSTVTCDKWKETAKQLNCPITFRFFHIDLKEALQRDSKRQNPVGETIIMSLYTKYLKLNTNI
jgi:predicted kinase